MYKFDPVNACFRIFHPKAWIAQDNSHCWKGLKVLFVDILQVVRVGGFLTKPNTKRVKNTVVFGIGLIDLREFPVFDELVIHD